MEGFIRINGQDVVSIRADSRADEPTFKLEPTSATKYGFQQELLFTIIKQKLAMADKSVDTSSWLG